MRTHYPKDIAYNGKNCMVHTVPGKWTKERGIVDIWCVDLPELLPFGAHWADAKNARTTTTLYCDTLPVLRRVCHLAEVGKLQQAVALLSLHQTHVGCIVGLSHIDFVGGK